MAAIVLLGAGASTGSCDSRFGSSTTLRTPPLGSRLFDELEAIGGIASSLPASLKVLFRDDFEIGMARLIEDQRADVMQFQRELAHYLALFTPGINNVYITMLKALGHTRVIYSSLNYDLLLELSAALLGHNVTYSPLKQDGTLRLLKLHGSVNFWPETRPIMLRNVSVINLSNEGSEIGAPIKVCNQFETLLRCKTENSLAPAIAVYAQGKPVRVSSSYVSQQQVWWASEVAAATTIFVVGVRVNPADLHIWDVLGKTRSRVTYFGFSEEDRRAFIQWKSTWNKRNAFFELADFTKSVPMMKHKLNSNGIRL
jgi:hypothetical protein